MSRAMARKLASGLLVAPLLLVALGGACNRADDPAAPVGAAASSPSDAGGEIHYRLEWSTERTSPLAGGAGWVVETNLGYRVTVEQGYLVDYSAELVECGGPRPVATAVRTSLLSDAWQALSFVGEAWAGHGSVAPNPAAVRTPLVESLRAPRTHDFGATRPGAWRYCQVHYLVARAPREARGLPQEVDMVDASLYLEGRYRAPGAWADVAFRVRTSVANGKVSDIQEVNTGAENAVVSIRRDLGTLFDGVDLTALSERDLGRAILKNLIASTELGVAPEERRG